VLCSQKYDLNWGFQKLREVWTKNFKTSPSEEVDVEMTGDGEGSGELSRDEDDFEKQMRLSNESDKTTVRVSPSQAQVDQFEGWLLEKPRMWKQIHGCPGSGGGI
jgi:hypothetical protein